MPALSLETAQTIASATLAAGRDRGFKPLSVAVYDERGALKALLSDDGTSLRRAEIAMGKAHGALAMGLGSRALNKMAVDRPHFIAAVTHAVGGLLVPVPGGVLVKDSQGNLLGSVGVSGDTSDNDEIAATAGIQAAGLVPDAGA
ncbi:MAG TPA: heme-binding protein [Microvirga sp.]|nr:heme-binding protein [Microvirga sp.]